MSLTPAETEMMLACLDDANLSIMPERGAAKALCVGLIQRGLVRAGGTARGCQWLSVTSAGARALIQAGCARASDFAGGVDDLNDRLVAYQSVIDAGLCDPAICDGWTVIRDCPYERVGLAVLERDGRAVRRTDGDTVSARAA